MPPRKRAAPAAPQLLTVKEAAARLGISHDSVERLVAAGSLAVVNVSTGARPRLRVSEDALREFITARTITGPRAMAQ